MNEQEMKDMTLNTKITIGSVDIQRFPGGWIYWLRHDGSVETNKSTSIAMSIAGVFVPENAFVRQP